MFRKDDLKSDRELKQLANQQANRECFECGQRCVTYVDMTLGSFVCTRCCGILRGLNPPHRLKSLSVCKFTEEEVELLRSRGNELLREYFPDRTKISDSFVRKEHEEQHKNMLTQKYCPGRLDLFNVQISKRVVTPERDASEDKSPNSDESGVLGDAPTANGLEKEIPKPECRQSKGPNSFASKAQQERKAAEKKVQLEENELEWGVFVGCAQGDADKNHSTPDVSNIPLKSDNPSGAELQDLFLLSEAFPEQKQQAEDVSPSWNGGGLSLQVEEKDRKEPKPVCPIIAEDPFIGIDQQLKKSLLRPPKT